MAIADSEGARSPEQAQTQHVSFHAPSDASFSRLGPKGELAFECRPIVLLSGEATPAELTDLLAAHVGRLSDMANFLSTMDNPGQFAAAFQYFWDASGQISAITQALQGRLSAGAAGRGE